MSKTIARKHLPALHLSDSELVSDVNGDTWGVTNDEQICPVLLEKLMKNF